MRHEAHFVEELSARHAEPIGSMLALSAIEPDPEQPRVAMGDLTELTMSIRDKGVLEPILVRPLPGAGERYRIVSGERRYRAAREAGLVEIPSIVMDVSEDEALEIALVENLQRKDLTPFEEAEGYQALADRYGYTHEQISEAVGKSRTVVTETLALLQTPRRAREAAQALGIASKSLLLEVLKAARDEEEMIRLLEEVASRGLSRDDVRERARRKSRSQRGSRRKPHVFKFQAPDRKYSLSLSFRKSEVERHDLITALEEILGRLRTEASGEA